MTVNEEKNNSLTLTIVVLVIILAATVAAWIILNSGKNQFIASDESLVQAEKQKFSSASTKAQEFIDTYRTSLFKNDFFQKIKSFVDLPLNVGQQGRPNPFETTQVDEDL